MSNSSTNYGVSGRLFIVFCSVALLSGCTSVKNSKLESTNNLNSNVAIPSHAEYLEDQPSESEVLREFGNELGTVVLLSSTFHSWTHVYDSPDKSYRIVIDGQFNEDGDPVVHSVSRHAN